ncbi:MAG: hypothetical protein HZA51_00625 [Planctomycetes bacterium]|nr:hypothetical protein [Planctomycetota bacterium]
MRERTTESNSSGPYRRRLTMIVLAGLLARGAVIVYAGQHPKTFDFPDSHRYFTVARNIAAGLGPIDSPTVRAGTDPIYPGLLSVGVWFGLTADDQLMRWAQLINTATGVASIGVLASLARKLFSERVALICAAIVAVDPITLFFNALALTETLYSTLLVFGVYLLIPGGKNKSQPNTVGVGQWAWGGEHMEQTIASMRGVFLASGVLGISALTRSSGLLFPFLLWVVLWNCFAPTFRRVVFALFFSILFGVILAPTMVRNLHFFHTFIPVRVGSGASLMEALGPWADGAPGMDRIVYPTFPPNANEHERDQICRDAAIEWAKQNPGRVLSLAWTKFCRTWSITINASDYSSVAYKLVGWLTVAPVFALAIAGVVMLRRNVATLALLLAPAAYFTILHMIFVGSVRYRMPAMPFVFILAAFALSRLFDRKAANV